MCRCGMVGNSWGCFTNGGTVDDDQWAPVVKDGKNSQLIEMNTMQYEASGTQFDTLAFRPSIVAGRPVPTSKLSGRNA